MRSNSTFRNFFLIVFLAVLGCKKSEDTTGVQSLPVVTTTPVINITEFGMVSGGNITEGGSSNVTARGVCWATVPNPETSDNHTFDGSGSGSFTSNLSGLTASTTYYLRAYATNSSGTSYGNEVTVTTTPSATQSLPTLTTKVAQSVSFSGFITGGIITHQGGSAVIARGICWDVSPNPDISSGISINGNGVGDFASSLSGLAASTTYYLRAYATNVFGTSYGNQISVTTSAVPATREVYVAGNIFAVPEMLEVASLWHNGVESELHPRSEYSNARGIFVENNDVYVVGETNHGAAVDYFATIWKNGIPSKLSQSSRSRAFGVCVANGDVYAVGEDYAGGPATYPILWKNGIESRLSLAFGHASSVAIFGADVYVGGRIEGGINTATIWKNGTAVSLPSSHNASVSALAFSGSDVYAAGQTLAGSTNMPAYWKNGALTVITTSNEAAATSIAVSGTDVFVAGIEWESTGMMAKVWKNGTLIMSESGRARSIKISGSDVYVVGNIFDSTGEHAVIWKNGVATFLGALTNSRRALDVFLK